jgi:hypothetical protein
MTVTTKIVAGIVAAAVAIGGGAVLLLSGNDTPEPEQQAIVETVGSESEPNAEMSAFESLSDAEKNLINDFIALMFARDFGGIYILFSAEDTIDALNRLLGSGPDGERNVRYRVDAVTSVRLLDAPGGEYRIEAARGAGGDGVVFTARFAGNPYFILSSTDYSGGTANGSNIWDWYNEPGGSHFHRSVSLINGLAQGECIYIIDGQPNMKVFYSDGHITILGERGGEIAFQELLPSGEVWYVGMSVEEVHEEFPKIERQPYDFDE